MSDARDSGESQARCDQSEDVQRLKCGLAKNASKTVNNILTVLNVLLKKPSSGKASTSFYDFNDYERLVTAAQPTDVRSYLLVLLGRRKIEKSNP